VLGYARVCALHTILRLSAHGFVCVLLLSVFWRGCCVRLRA